MNDLEKIKLMLFLVGTICYMMPLATDINRMGGKIASTIMVIFSTILLIVIGNLVY